MAVEFTPEQQELFNTTLAEKKQQWSRKFEGYISPDEVATIRGDYDKQIADLTKQLEGATAESASHKQAIAERDSKIKEYELHPVKSRIAHESGLSYDAIGYLHGTDEESVRKSAEGLKALMGKRTAPDPVNEPNVNNSTKDAMRKLAKSFGGKE